MFKGLWVEFTLAIKATYIDIADRTLYNYRYLMMGRFKMSSKNNLFKMEMLLLSILKKQDCYGYEITKLLRKYSNNLLTIQSGTMYPILCNLLEDGYVSSYEEVVNKKIRVYYHIEPAGLEKLNKLIIDYTIMVSGVNSVINCCNGERDNEEK